MKYLEEIRNLLKEKRFDEVQHILLHENFEFHDCGAIVREIKNNEDYITDFIKLKIAVLSSYTIQNINDTLELDLIKNGFYPEIKYGSYNQYIQELIDERSFVYSFNPDIIIMALDTPTFFENLHFKLQDLPISEADEIINSKLKYVTSVLEKVSKKLKSKIIITNLEVPIYSPYGIRDVNIKAGYRYLISRFNYRLLEEINNMNNIVILDFDRVASYVGKMNITEQKYFYLGKFYLSKKIIPLFCREILKIINSSYGKSKKCLVVDLDNTLWGGIVGEEGPLGIKIGKEASGSIYEEIQNIILSYNKNGIILAINSKNNFDDVMEVFEKNKNMVLKKENFSCMKINWEDKSKNMLEIAKELNIGLDSLAFLEDSGFERENIKRKLPMVYIIGFPKDICDLPEVLKNLHCFESLELTEEDKKRNEAYAQQSKRLKLQESFNNLTDYLFDIKTEIEIKENSLEDIERITQLINKTNQFNLCTNRYSKEEVESMIKSKDFRIFSMKVWDKFGELGLTGVAIVKDNGDEWEITDFLMSCRIMGRDIEKEFLRNIILKLPKKERIVGSYIPTKKNIPVVEFYDKFGFEKEDEKDGKKIYKFGYKEDVRNIEWIKVR